MHYSYTGVWQELTRMVRSNGALLAALTGAFVLLPSLLLNYFLPQPRQRTGESDAVAAANLEAMVHWFSENFWWLLASNVVNMIGAIAIYLLLLGSERITVGRAIAAALPILPFYFLASVASSIMIGIGFALLVVPGLYLLGRLAPVGPVVVAEARRNPIEAIGRTFALTRGAGWRNAGFIILVMVPAFLVSFAATAVLGTIFLLAGGPRVGPMLALILNSVTTSALSLLYILVAAALYRTLSAPAPATSGT
jgi:hypothetical protein